MHTKAQIQTGKREDQTFVAQQKTCDHHGKWHVTIQAPRPNGAAQPMHKIGLVAK
jgi:hypothetical protein